MSGVLLAIATLLVAWMAGGRSGILYVFIYMLATMPGWPVGWTLFGRGPAGWIAGALLGYALTALALWTPIAAGVASRNAFLGAWLTIGVVSWLACRRVKGPLVPLTDWSRRDSAALFLLMLIAPAILALPYRNIGARDAEGNRYYRAYFTADFLWHTALTAELTKYQMPPRDPYLGDRPIHYYWTYFLVPAAVAGTGPMAVRNVQLALKVNALCSGLLFIGIIVIAARAAVPRTGPVALAVTLTVLAASSEGAYALYDLYAHGQPLAGV
ncbi:MAG: hypothetical protein HYX76_06285, partial [Acidobacteria bacterium]|nr:hypothetical protein [Acidobacteriota bacterium]